MRLLARSILTCLIIAILVTPGISEDFDPFVLKVSDSGPSLTVTVKYSTVVVKDGSRTVQKIPYDKESMDELMKEMQEVNGDLSDLFSSLDMNFDGFLDLLISTSLYTRNTSYICYLWNPKIGKFEINEPLGDICNLTCDEETKKIRGFFHESASDNVEEEYEWLDGEITLTWRKIQIYDFEKELFVVTEERLNSDGVMVQVSEKFLSEDELIKLLEGESFLDEKIILGERVC